MLEFFSSLNSALSPLSEFSSLGVFLLSEFHFFSIDLPFLRVLIMETTMLVRISSLHGFIITSWAWHIFISPLFAPPDDQVPSFLGAFPFCKFLPYFIASSWPRFFSLRVVDSYFVLPFSSTRQHFFRTKSKVSLSNGTFTIGHASQFFPWGVFFGPTVPLHPTRSFSPSGFTFLFFCSFFF